MSAELQLQSWKRGGREGGRERDRERWNCGIHKIVVHGVSKRDFTSSSSCEYVHISECKILTIIHVHVYVLLYTHTHTQS